MRRILHVCLAPSFSSEIQAMLQIGTTTADMTAANAALHGGATAAAATATAAAATRALAAHRAAAATRALAKRSNG